VNANESAGESDLEERITAFLETAEGSATVPEIISEFGDEVGQKRIRRAITDLESEGALICETQENKRGKPILVTVIGEPAAGIGLLNQPAVLPQMETGELVQ